MEKSKKESLLLALIPLLVLISIITIGVIMFGDSVTAGPSQIALLLATLVASLIAIYKLKVPWEKLEEGILDHLSKTGSAIFILLMIGALTATWMLSGIVPSMIYYSLKIIDPDLFLVIIFILSGIVSVIAGSSWTTVGTLGVAMFSAGQVLGFSPGWLAGAIISGAYFGDKVSPISDTTNLSASVAGVNLYTHVKYNLITTIPAFVLSVIFFTIAGFTVDTVQNISLNETLLNLKEAYNISLWFFIVPAITLLMMLKKISPFITLFISAIIGAIVACLFQPQIINQIAPENVDTTYKYVYSTLQMLSSEVSIETGNELLTRLSSTNGMAGMMNTVWLILCVVTFGGVMEASGLIFVITNRITKFIHNTTSLVGSTIVTCIFFNLTLSDQYLSILLAGKMFSNSYKKRGYKPELMSRTLQDSATVTSVLVPWNSCAVVQSSALGIPTLAYIPYCFFNLITPIVSIVVAAIGYKIQKINSPCEEEK